MIMKAEKYSTRKADGMAAIQVRGQRQEETNVPAPGELSRTFILFGVSTD